MLDEGTAREIINRIQKLRKKAHLVPTDLIKVYYNISPEGEMLRIAKEFTDFITNVLKVPFINGSPVGNVIIEETQSVINNNILIISIFKSSFSAIQEFLNAFITFFCQNCYYFCLICKLKAIFM